MLAGDNVRKVAIVGGNRIPFARSNTAYFEVDNQEMLTAALNGLVDRFKLHGERMGEVAAGAVMKHAKDFNLVRECVLGSKLAPETPAYDLQQACGTGLEAAILVANKIALGQVDCAVAGGVDTTSDAPLGVNEQARKIFMEINRAKSNGDKLKQAVKLLNPKLMIPDIPKNGEPRTGLSMGEHQAITAAEWGISREAQDELAWRSHQNLAKSYEEGWQGDLMTPFHGLERDNNMRGDSTIEKLSTLKPVFGGSEGTMTAANSTPLTDGASTVLLASEDWAQERGLPVQAWNDETFCKERLGRDKPLGEIDMTKLNVKGSSLAAGHPFAATGARILANAAKLLNEKGSGRCLISICAAGGQGVVAIVEK